VLLSNRLTALGDTVLVNACKKQRVILVAFHMQQLPQPPKTRTLTMCCCIPCRHVLC
jgi:hypothetical protein